MQIDPGPWQERGQGFGVPSQGFGAINQSGVRCYHVGSVLSGQFGVINQVRCYQSEVRCCRVGSVLSVRFGVPSQRFGAIRSVRCYQSGSVLSGQFGAPSQRFGSQRWCRLSQAIPGWNSGLTPHPGLLQSQGFGSAGIPAGGSDSPALSAPPYLVPPTAPCPRSTPSSLSSESQSLRLGALPCH